LVCANLGEPIEFFNTIGPKPDVTQESRPVASAVVVPVSDDDPQANESHIFRQHVMCTRGRLADPKKIRIENRMNTSSSADGLSSELMRAGKQWGGKCTRCTFRLMATSASIRMASARAREAAGNR
jgi:hypothetical protein